MTNVSYGGPMLIMSWARRILQARSVSGQSHHRTIEEHRVLFLVRSLSSQAIPSLIRAPSTVYDVANRESFDALPRWYSELETYVSDSVVKILVGNKVDKVSRTALSR